MRAHSSGRPCWQYRKRLFRRKPLVRSRWRERRARLSLECSGYRRFAKEAARSSAPGGRSADPAPRAARFSLCPLERASCSSAGARAQRCTRTCQRRSHAACNAARSCGAVIGTERSLVGKSATPVAYPRVPNGNAPGVHVRKRRELAGPGGYNALVGEASRAASETMQVVFPRSPRAGTGAIQVRR